MKLTTRGELLQGYAWHVYPLHARAIRGKGFHSYEVRPVEDAAEYLCDYGVNGYLVLTEEAVPPAVAEGWQVESAEIEEDFRYADGHWTCVLVGTVDHVRGADGTTLYERLFAGYARGY